jgi:hypothetical protein
MDTDKQAAAQRIADQLFEAEYALDEALAKMATLVAAIPAARGDLGVSMKTGASAVTRLAGVVPVLAELRQTVAGAHDELAVIQRAIGVRPNMVGGGEKDGDQQDVMSPGLRRVV